MDAEGWCAPYRVEVAPCFKKLELRKNLKNLHAILAFRRTASVSDLDLYFIGKSFSLLITYFPSNLIYPFTNGYQN